ncbi:unnamed protein product [Gordionus sp. m RMFG-2023]|uniref:probable imidazolonepropionase n=1 Tax=Gordionus sp. m RMFG-2023 TaxID=3053472 RepID=UPI0030DF779F
MSRPTTHKLLIYSAKQIVQISKNGEEVLKGIKQDQPIILNEKFGDNGETIGLSIVIDMTGRIEAVDFDDQIKCQFRFAIFEQSLCAKGLVILPGLIDAHTHPIWAGDRVEEFAMKQKGATYNEITLSGGGIYKTVRETDLASDEKLYNLLKNRLYHMMKSGTTLVECKSGYGLGLEQEMRLLTILKRANDELPLTLSITYLGAHAVPSNTNVTTFAQEIADSHIPFLLDAYLENKISLQNVDVFCETGYFDVENSFKILKAARRAGFNINVHGDELTPIGSYKLVDMLRRDAHSCNVYSVDQRYYSISHLEELSQEGIEVLAKDCKFVAVLLPLTKFILGITDKNKPPARQLIQNDVPVALGTDFNPSSHCYSMPIAMYTAVVTMGMTLEESLVASTLNAAASLNMSQDYGSLERDKMGDLLVLDCSDWKHLIYQLGNHDQLINYVIKRGSIIYGRAPFRYSKGEPQTGEMIFAQKREKSLPILTKEENWLLL